MPAETVESLWTGESEIELGAGGGGLDTRRSKPARDNPRATMMRQRFQIAQLVQHLAPNLHWWNQSTVFSVDRVRAEVGWEPQHTIASMVDDTYSWFRNAGLHETREYDWSFEDRLLALVGRR